MTRSQRRTLRSLIRGLARRLLRRRTSRSPSAPIPVPIVTRFVVLGLPRSGSTLLVDELNRRWPQIRSEREVFNRANRNATLSFDEITHNTFFLERSASIVGCKIFVNQISEQQLGSLLQLEGMKVIILRRRNLLSRHVSEEIAKRTARWMEQPSRRKDDPLSVEERQITINCRSFHTKMREALQWYRDCERMSEGLPKMDVWYEDLAADLDTELRRLATFLGAGEPAHESPPLLTKQNPEPLSVLITNFDEVREYLQTAGCSEFLTMDEAEPQDRTSASSPAVADELSSTWLPCWPSDPQKILLRALFGPEELFPDRWNSWLSSTKVWTRFDRISGLYPTIHHQLRRRDDSTGLVPAIKDQSLGDTTDAPTVHDFRKESMLSIGLKLRLIDALRELVDHLAPRDLDLILLGSTALAIRTQEHDDEGFRTLPMSSIDLTTRPEQFESVTDALHRLGWITTSSNATTGAMEPTAPVIIVHRNGLQLRLHRAMLRAITTEELERDLRTGLTPAPVEGGNTTMPAPAELLLTIVIDGLLTRPPQSIDWILAAHRLIADTGDDLDWNRLATLAVTHRLQAPIHAALTLLDNLTDDLLTPTAIAVIETIIVAEQQQSDLQQLMSRP